MGLTTKNIYDLQSRYNVSEGYGKLMGVSFKSYVNSCKQYISDYNDSGKDGQSKTISDTVNLIEIFVNNHKVLVEGYSDSEGVVDTGALITDLIDAITGAGVIKEALEDADVEEIQINDYKTIYVVKGGIKQPYIDKMGRAYQFNDDEELAALITRLTDDNTGSVPQFTDGNPIINAKLPVGGYRLNAIHHSATARDRIPNDFPATAIVIRKFPEMKMNLSDLVSFGALTDEMSLFLEQVGRACIGMFCIGEPGSGKTTLLNATVQGLPPELRIVAVQNPTEITFFERDKTGRNTRNVVHIDAKEGENRVNMERGITNTLRQTPDVLLIGESREAGEFMQLMRARKLGMPVYSTFHAGSAYEAVTRIKEETGLEIRDVANNIDIIVTQTKFNDGVRLVTAISEIRGVKDGEPVIQDLFRYEFNGAIITHPENGRTHPDGEFKQCGVISENLAFKFLKGGVDPTILGDLYHKKEKQVMT